MTIEEQRFAGGIAVVTGGGSGIGEGFARRLATIGMTVVIADISGERAEAVAAGIVAGGGRAEGAIVDVSRAGELDRLAEEVTARHGPVRLLVNNAGIETFGLSWQIPVERWDATIATNVAGIVHGCRAFVPRMIAAGEEAWIANLSSVGAFGTMPTQAAYILSKHAVQAFSECLYLEMELAGAPIHVSTVVPGMVRTRIFEPANGRDEPEAAARYRATMRAAMAGYGMDAAEACERFVRQIAENRFWVDSHPEVTRQATAARADFLRGLHAPALTDETRALL